MMNNGGGPPPRLRDEETGVPRGAWQMILAIVIAKAALILTVVAIDFSWMSSLYVLLTTWTWLIVGGVLFWGPATYAIRLRRARSRRALLQQQEWLIDRRNEETPARLSRLEGGD
jgi:hypothetical protein